MALVGARMDPPALRRRLLLFAAALAGGFAYGYLTAHIPSPDEIGVFWVSNLSAPWLALAFLAGWPQRSLAWGALAGFCAELACVVGFYAMFLHFGDPAPLGLSPALPLAERVVANLGSWLAFAAPWLLAAAVAGPCFGALGGSWGRSRNAVAGGLLAAAFIFEVAAWSVRNRALWPPYLLWVAEVLLGVLLLAAVLTASRRRRGAT